jgi:hypothetical protein
MDHVVRYLKVIVEPTVDEFRKNPRSERHAILACIALYHSIDRASFPRKAGTLNQEWRALSSEFALIDIVAHDAKHVRSEWRNVARPLPRPPLAPIGRMGLNTHTPNDTGRREALANLLPVVEKALAFVWDQVRPAGE